MLSLLSILITLATLTSSVRSEETAMIVGGEESNRRDFPYFVELGICGGTLIAPDIVLFAAHCINEANNGEGYFTGTQVVVNGYRRNKVDNQSIVRHCMEYTTHDGYNSHTAENDFALCKLNEPAYIPTDRTVLEWNQDAAEPQNNDELIVMGQGRLGSDEGAPEMLHDVTVPYIPNDECRSPEMYGNQIKDSMLCAGYPEGGRDSCQGDSGGPIVKRTQMADGTFHDLLVGVVSWGEGCAEENRPGVYARTSDAKDWILDTMCEWDSIDCPRETAQVEDDGCARNEVKLQIKVKTDKWASETQWWLDQKQSGNWNVQTTRKYYLKHYNNVHNVCVRKNKCYRFEIADTHGDGMMTTEDGKPKGKWSVGLAGQKPYHKGGPDYGHGTLIKFCVNKSGKRIVKRLPKKN